MIDNSGCSALIAIRLNVRTDFGDALPVGGRSEVLNETDLRTSIWVNRPMPMSRALLVWESIEEQCTSESC